MSEYDMNGLCIVTSKNELDIRFTIPYFQGNIDFDSSVVIVNSKNINGLAWIEPVHRDMEGHSFVPYNTELNSTSGVSYQNELDLGLKVVQAPINSLIVSINNDVYLREARPTINYGQAESLIIGSALEGEYKSLIQLNIQNYLNLTDENVISANLILHLSSDSFINPNLIIDVYEVKTAWQENNITWQSELAFEITPTPITNFTASSSILTINIKDYLKQLKTQGKTSVNLLLKARNIDHSSITYIHSKDSPITQFVPYIEIRHQSNLWSGESNDTVINGSAIVKRYGNKDLINSAIPRIHKNAGVLGTVLIGRWSGNDINSQVAIPYYVDHDTDSEADIYIKSDLDSSVYVNIFTHSELESTGFVYTYTSKDLESNTNIFIPTNLDGSGIVRLTNKIDIDADVTVKGRYVVLDSSATVTLERKSDLNSSAIPRLSPNKDLDSEAIVYYSTNLSADAIARRNEFKDILGSSIPRFTDIIDLESESNIYHMINLLSDSITRITDTLDLNSLIYIWQKIDLDSSVELRSVKNLISQAIIRQKGQLLLESDVIVRQFDVSEIDTYVEVLRASAIFGYALVRRIDRFYLDCNVTITTGARQWIPNVHASNIFTYTDCTLPRRWKRENFIT